MPFAGLWLCLAVLFYGTELATLRIDEESYSSWCGEYCDIGTSVDLAIFAILFYMIAAYSLFPKEFDDATIDFLHSLPVSRAAIFFIKVLSACILLCTLLLVEHIIEILLLSFNNQSLTGKPYWHIDATLLLRGCLFAIVIVSHGVFISWFRTIGLVVYSVYLVALVWIESAFGTPAFFSIFEFFNNEYDGQRLLIDWQVVGFHLVVAAILYVVSYLLWTNTDSRPRTPGTSKAARVWPILATVFGFLLVAGWMSTLIQTKSNELSSAELGYEQTEHYNFAFALKDTAAMEALLEYAEDDYDALATMLSAQERPVSQVDMTSESEHALGLATWKKIKMIIGSTDEVNPLTRRVLSHETAHVFQSVESQRNLSKQGGTVGFFIEGMAQYTSFSIVPDEPARNSNWLVSSIAWERQDINFDQLSNRFLFEELYDPEMLYGIGDIWVQAMSDTCGTNSIGDFLRATARDDAPQNLSGSQFWRISLQHIGCELEQVNDRWRQLMKEVIEKRSGEGVFPIFSDVSITRAPDSNAVRISAAVEAEDDPELPTQFYIRIRSEARLASAVSPVIRGKLVSSNEGSRVEFSIVPRLVRGNRFDYQMGFTPLPGSRNYYDRWRSGSIPVATAN